MLCPPSKHIATFTDSTQMRLRFSIENVIALGEDIRATSLYVTSLLTSYNILMPTGR